MIEREWAQLYSQVTDRMKEYVRDFVVPLSHETESEVRLVGTGTFVQRADGPAIVTCEHVANTQPLNFRPYGRESVYGYRGKWALKQEPVDAAWTIGTLASPDLPAGVVRSQQIAAQHSPQPRELLFFFGYSGENSSFVWENHITNGTGYLTQQNRHAPHDPRVVELLWPNGKEVWTDETTEEARKNIRFSDPAGFSGSLVWNTRFLETGMNLAHWTPKDAVVTALLKRFVPDEGVLLATPIEAVRSAGLI